MNPLLRLNDGSTIPVSNIGRIGRAPKDDDRTVYDRPGPDDDEFIFDAEPIIGLAVDGSYSLPITASEGIVVCLPHLCGILR